MGKPRTPRFTWPPEGDDFRRRFHKEIAGSAAILQALGADIAIAPKDSGDLRTWLASQDGGMGGLIEGGGRSWNHPQILMVARGLVFGDWGDATKLCAMQSGAIPGEGAARWLSGEEPRSTDYDPYRWAAYLIFRARHPSMITRQAATDVLRRDVALSDLGAVPWADTSGDLSNARGELWHHGATLSPVGERSPKTSNPDALGLVERMTRGKGGNDREGFAGAVADIVGWPTFGDPDVATCLAWLAGASVFGEFHFVEYPEGHLVWRPEQKNPNTPSALWSWADHATQKQERGFPYPPGSKNRGKEAPKSLGCGIENGEIVMRTEFGVARRRLPTSTPIWSVIVDGNGARFEGEAPRERPTDPPATPPPASGPDIEALVAEVIALGAQPDQAEPVIRRLRDSDWLNASRMVGGLTVPRKKNGAKWELSDRLARLAEGGR